MGVVLPEPQGPGWCERSCPVQAVTQRDRPNARLPQTWAASEAERDPGTGMKAQSRSRSPEQPEPPGGVRAERQLVVLVAEAAGTCPVSLWSFSAHLQGQEMAACARTTFTSSALMALSQLIALSGAVGTGSAPWAGWPRRARGFKAPGRGSRWMHPHVAALCSAWPLSWPPEGLSPTR